MIARRLWLSAGFVCVGLGWLGLILPMMPGVVFFIMAAFCFARSSPVMEQRLLDHPHIGPHLISWRERRAISRKGKRAAVITMTIAGIATALLVGFPTAWWSIGSMSLVAIWLWTRPE